jgi:hypothetical protein
MWAGCNSRTNGRPWIAMILAYVLALQAIFAALVGAQHAVAASGSTDVAVICFGMGAAQADDEDGTAPQRLHQGSCTVCAFGGMPALEAVVAFALAPSSAAPLDHPRIAAGPAAIRLRTPRLSQGPPQNA